MTTVNTHPSARLWVVLFIVVVLVILSLGYWHYQIESQKIREEKYHELSAIGQLKAHEIITWRTERLADVKRATESHFFKKALSEWLKTPDSPILTDEWHQRLTIEKEGYGYSDVLLLDIEGQILLSVRDHPDPFDPATAAAVRLSKASQKPALSELYVCPQGVIHIDAVSVIFDSKGEAIATFVMRNDAKDFLYPLIQSWPMPSQTAETLLIKRDGDAILFLNELRHQSETAMKFTLPLTRTDLPALQAVLGATQLFEGKDYRGVDVLSDLRPIPDSSWYMVSKIDSDEFLKEIRFNSIVVVVVIVILIALAAVLIAFIYRQKQVGLYQNLLKAEQAELESQKIFRATLYGIGDGVITTDKNSNVIQMNSVAEQLTGWTEAEAKNKPLHQVFRIINETTRAEVANPVERVLKEGKIIGLANHTLLIAKDGAERPIADSGAPVKLVNDDIFGVVLVFRDQTDAIHAQKALQESEEKFKYIFDHSVIGKSITFPTGEINVNRAFSDLLGYTTDELENKKWQDITHPDDIELSQEKIKSLINGEKESVRFIKRYSHKNGSVVWTDIGTALRRDSNGNPMYFMTTINDITAKKKAEEREQLARDVLERLNNPSDISKIVDDILKIIQTKTGIEAIGLRMRSGNDFPYHSSCGFTHEFIDAENKLVAYDQNGVVCRKSDGTINLECTCGLVITGKFDKNNPLFTPYGSAWTNDSLPFLDVPRDQDQRHNPRNRCIHDGYRSVALIPLRKDNETIGLLQLNDKRTNQYSIELIRFFEGLSNSISIAIMRQQSEIGLRESEERFQQLFDNMSNGVAVYQAVENGQNFVFVNLNKTGQKSSQATLEEVIGRCVTDVYPAVEKIGLLDIFRRVWRTGEPERLPTTLYSDGRIEQWVENYVYKLPSGLIVAIYSDVTQEKKATIAQDESAKKYQVLFENSSESIFVVQNGRIIFANPITTELFGFSVEKLSQSPFTEFIHPDDRAMVLDRYQRRLKGEALPRQYAFRVLNTGGNIHWVWLNVVMINWEGKPSTLCFINDITDIRRAEDELKKSEERYRTLFEKAHDGIVVADATTGILMNCNAAICRLVERTESELIGQHQSILHPPEEIINGQSNGYQRHSQNPDQIIEENVISKSGKRIPVEVRASHFKMDGKDYLLGMFRDITERKQAQEEKQKLHDQLRQSHKMEAVGQLAGGIAHDFNNALNAIIGYSELTMMNMDATNPVYDNLNKIKKSGERAASLTRQLLAFSRKQVLMPVIMNLNDVIMTVTPMLERLIKEDIFIKLNLDDNLSYFEADPGQIEQIIMNLSVNARDAMPNGGVLTIETQNVHLDDAFVRQSGYLNPGDYVMMSVSDIGCGMDPETLSHMFEPFFTTKEVGKGTGLGLATVYGIVKQSDGYITVASELGKGTVFKVYFAAVDAKPNETAKRKESRIFKGTETVLVVEDNDVLRELATEILTMSGYNVLVAADGNEGIDVCRTHSTDIRLIISDVIMPIMNGKEMADAIAEFLPGVKVLFASGYTDDEIIHHGVLDADVPFIQKPYTMDELLNKVRTLLDS
ncbi:MAG: PAS domain S-box protein [Planctomycetota bacterium]